MSIINNKVRGCYSTLNPNLLPVCYSNESQVPEYDIINSILERRCNDCGNRSSKDIISLDEYVNFVVKKASYDCLTLYQAVQVCSEKAIYFPPPIKSYVNTFVRCLFSHILSHKLLIYALKPIQAMRFSAQISDPLKKFSKRNKDTTESYDFHPSDFLGHWENYLCDIAQLDQFYVVKDKNVHLNRWDKLCPSFVVAAPGLVHETLIKIRKKLCRGEQVFLRNDEVKAIDILLCVRFIAATSNKSYDYHVMLKQPRDDDLPHAIFTIPRLWKKSAIKELEEGANEGTRQFIPFCKALHKESKVANETHFGNHASGFFRFLRDFNWQNLNACIYDPNVTKECDLALQDLPESLKIARKNPSLENRLYVGFRLKCLAKDCQNRFRNDLVLKEHLRNKHGVCEEDMADIRNADAHETASYFRFADERDWIKRHENLTTEVGCRRCNNLVDLTGEFIKMHECNVFLYNHLQCQIDALLPNSSADTLPFVARTLDELRKHQENGRRLMLTKEEFAKFYGIWIFVMNDRTLANRQVGNFINQQKHELIHSEVMQTYRSAADDYRDSVRDAGGTDFTHMSHDSLIFNRRQGEEQGYRLSLLAAQLGKEHRDPSNVKSAVRQSRKRAAEKLQTCFSHSKDDDDDDDDDHNDQDYRISQKPKIRNIADDNEPDHRSIQKSTSSSQDINDYNTSGRWSSFPSVEGAKKNLGPIPMQELIYRVGRVSPAVNNSLVLYQPERIKVNQFDVADKIRQLICRIYSKLIYDDNEFQSIIHEIVRFLDAVFKLSNHGKEFAYRILFTSDVFQTHGKARCEKITSLFALLFRFFNCNDENQLNDFFARRKYNAADPFQAIIEVDEDTSYHYSTHTSVDHVEFNNIDNIERYVMEIEKRRMAKTRNQLALESDSVLLKMQCTICLEVLGLSRPVEAIPCMDLRVAKDAAAAKRFENRKCDSKKTDNENWNGAHIFHKSCLQQWIRCSALDPAKFNVTCPRCRVEFYDRAALNAVRFKLFNLGKDEEPTDDVYEVKSFLNRSNTFLVKSQEELDNVCKNVKKQLRFDFLVTKFREKQKTITDPYDIKQNIREYLASNDEGGSNFDDGDEAKIIQLIEVMHRDKLLNVEDENMLKKKGVKTFKDTLGNKTCRQFNVLDYNYDDEDNNSDSDFEDDIDALGCITSHSTSAAVSYAMA